MSLQELFHNAKQLEAFERVALEAGYRNFSKRGRLYCLSDLNVFATGYVAGQKEALKNVIVVGDGMSEAESDLIRHSLDVEYSPGFMRGIEAVNNEARPA